MSSVEFVATAAKYYIVHQIIKKVMPFVVFPLMFILGVKAVLIGLGLMLVGCVLWAVWIVVHALCTGRV